MELPVHLEQNKAPQRFMPTFSLSEDAANYVFQISNVTILVCTIVGGIAAVALYWSGKIKDRHDERKKIHNEQVVASTKQDAAKAIEKAAQLEGDLKLTRSVLNGLRQPRSISPDVEAQIIGALQSSSKGKVLVQADWMDGEAKRFAEQIKGVLSKAGFALSDLTLQVLSLNSEGAYLLLKDTESPPAHAFALQKAFLDAGIKLPAEKATEGMQRTNQPDMSLSDDMVIIWVTKKPL